MSFLFSQHQVFERTWVRCFKFHAFAREWMVEAEFESVKRQPSERVGLTAVACVAHNRMSEGLHVYANLVLATRFQLQFHERVAIGPFDGAVVRDGEFSPVVHRRGTDIQLAVGEPGAYHALVFLHVAHDDGHVAAVVHDVVPVVAERAVNRLGSSFMVSDDENLIFDLEKRYGKENIRIRSLGI